MRWIGPIQGWVDRGHRFLAEDLWSHERYSGASDPRKAWILVLRSLFIVWTGFSRERLKLRAAALTYTTLLSLVPALAVVFSIFTAFDGLSESRERIQRSVAELLSVGHQEKVFDFLNQFVGSASTIGGVGILFLLVTSLSLLSNIEKAFNDIWGLKQDRSWIRRFQSYWPLLTLGPVLFGMSLTATASFQASETVRDIADVFPGGHFVLTLLPIVLTWAGFTLSYLIMPNTRVPARYALIGGVVAGTIWEIAKRVYAVYTSRALTYSAIYGSLSVVPLSIIWIYVSWLVALIGASIAFAAQNAETYEPDQDSSRLSQRERERLAVWAVITVFQRFERNGGALRADELMSRVSGPPRGLRRIIDQLVDGGLFIVTMFGPDRAYAPGRAAHNTTIADILRSMRHQGAQAGTDEADVPHVAMHALAILEESETETFARLDRVSIAQLLAELRQGAQESEIDEVLGHARPA